MSESFTAWVNFEVLNSYNSRQGWGNFSLEEAWVNYQYSDAFNVKVGSLIPRFAYLNEIKNRMPLLPYILRPLIYEASISAITTSTYVPEKALIQISGNLPVGDVTFDYAAFMGNSDKSYIASTNVIAGAGSDTSKFKTFGGRLGAKYGELRFGLSTSFDHQNDQGTLNQDVPRSRYAVDLGYNVYNFTFDGEYIYVKLSPENITSNLDKNFFYGTLGYNFSEKVSAYVTGSHLKDAENSLFTAGLTGLGFGAVYKPLETVVVKAGWSRYYSANNFFSAPSVPAHANVDYKSYAVAVSVLF